MFYAAVRVRVCSKLRTVSGCLDSSTLDRSFGSHSLDGLGQHISYGWVIVREKTVANCALSRFLVTVLAKPAQ